MTGFVNCLTRKKTLSQGPDESGASLSRCLSTLDLTLLGGEWSWSWSWLTSLLSWRHSWCWYLRAGRRGGQRHSWSCSSCIILHCWSRLVLLSNMLRRIRWVLTSSDHWLVEKLEMSYKKISGLNHYYYNSARCPHVKLRNFCSITTTAILFSVTLNCVLYLGKRSEAQRKPS